MVSSKTLLRCVVALAILVVNLRAQAQTPSRTILVVTQEPNTLTIVDPAAKKVIGLVPTGKDPHEVVVSPDGKLAYVSSTERHSIDVIDLESRKELRRISTIDGSLPHGIMLREGKFYFTATGFRAIGRYDMASNQVDWMFGVGTGDIRLVVASKDSKQLFAPTRKSNAIVAIERSAKESDWKLTLIPVGKGPQGTDISPDDKEIWTSSQEDGTVSIIDVSTKKVVQTLSLQTKRSNRLKFTPDGKRVLVSDAGAGDLLVLDAAARKEVKRLQLGKAPNDMLFEPDSAAVYVTLRSGGEIVRVDLKTMEVTARISVGNQPEAMAWR